MIKPIKAPKIKPVKEENQRSNEVCPPISIQILMSLSLKNWSGGIGLIFKKWNLVGGNLYSVGKKT